MSRAENADALPTSTDSDGTISNQLLFTTAHQRFGRLVRQLREQRHMTQQQLAERVTAHGMRWYQSTVNKFETGQRPRFSIDEAVVLAVILDIDLDAYIKTESGRV